MDFGNSGLQFMARWLECIGKENMANIKHLFINDGERIFRDRPLRPVWRTLGTLFESLGGELWHVRVLGSLEREIVLQHIDDRWAIQIAGGGVGGSSRRWDSEPVWDALNKLMDLATTCVFLTNDDSFIQNDCLS